MGIRVYLKSTFHRLVLLPIAAVVLFAFAFDVKANNTDTLTLTDITYKYEIYRNDIGQITCSGSLDFAISISTNDSVSHFIMERTMRPFAYRDSTDRFIPVKSYYSSETTHIYKTDVRWATHFRLNVCFTDNRWAHTPIYSINDYIDEADLKLLLEQASVENLDVEIASLYVKNKRLLTTARDPISVAVYDMQGRQLFSGSMDQSTEVPLDHVMLPYIVAKYTSANQTITKKLLIK